jgi:hypothetical protein
MAPSDQWWPWIWTKSWGSSSEVSVLWVLLSYPFEGAGSDHSSTLISTTKPVGDQTVLNRLWCPQC